MRIHFGQTTRLTARQFQRAAKACQGLKTEAEVRAMMTQKLFELTGDLLVKQDYHCEPLKGGAIAVHTGPEIALYLKRLSV